MKHGRITQQQIARAGNQYGGGHPLEVGKQRRQDWVPAAGGARIRIQRAPYKIFRSLDSCTDLERPSKLEAMEEDYRKPLMQRGKRPKPRAPYASVYFPRSIVLRAICCRSSIVLKGSYFARRRRIASCVRNMSPSDTAAVIFLAADSILSIACDR